MIAVLGSFRFPPGALDRARPLFRVTELWDDRAALSAHFDTPHMREWVEQRAALGFCDRRIALHDIGVAEELSLRRPQRLIHS